jgi:hypothetical protein
METNMVLRAIRSGVLLSLLVRVCGSPPAIAAENDNSYAKLEHAILDGKDIRMTLDLGACFIHGTAKPGPAIRGSLHFDGYMIESDQSIAFATTHFTVRADNTPVDEFLSFKVQPTGKVDARTRFLSPSTYAIFHDAEFDCHLGKGIAFHW